MATEKGRDLKPRQRGNRPILEGEEMRDVLIADEGGWRVEPPISSRLWQKSALGKTVKGGAVLLSPAETLFCHWHRNLALPKNFMAEMLVSNPRLLHEAVAIETVRSGGEILSVCDGNLPHGNLRCANSWGMRWERTAHPSKDPPVSQVRWFISSDDLDLADLQSWVREVEKMGQTAEVVVVDSEYDSTIYRLSSPDPRGKLTPPSEIKMPNLSGEVTSFIQYTNWPLQNVGVPQAGGISLDNTEKEWLENYLQGSEHTGNAYLLNELLERGLLARPGFKYGCKWRVYDDDISKVHAPWLMSIESEMPRSWEEACLRARLSAGVNKKWVCIQHNPDGASFLSIERVLLGR